MFIMNITAGPNKGKALPYHIIRDNFTKTGSVWNTNSFVDALTFLDSIRNLLVEYEATEDFLNSDARAQLKVASRKLFDQFVDELPHRLSEKVKADGTGSIPKMDDKLRLDASILRYVESVRLLEDDQSVPWLLSEGPRVASISSLGSCLLYQAGGVQNGVSEPQATTHDVFEENYNSAAYLADIIPGAVHNELGKATEFTERASDQGSQSVVIDETLSKIRLLQARISDMAIP